MIHARGRRASAGMSDNGRILDRINAEALNGGNADVLDELLADDFVEHNPMPGLTGDRDGFKAMVRELHAGLSDFHTEVVDLVVLRGGHQIVRAVSSGRRVPGEAVRRGVVSRQQHAINAQIHQSYSYVIAGSHLNSYRP